MNKNMQLEELSFKLNEHVFTLNRIIDSADKQGHKVGIFVSNPDRKRPILHATAYPDQIPHEVLRSLVGF